MIIGNYTADDSVGETASPSPISPESWCRKDTIRGGRRVDGADACHVRARGREFRGSSTAGRRADKPERLKLSIAGRPDCVK